MVLARKYRPQTFDDLIGQEAMVQTLSNAFASGRIAHGYMLTGVRGVGKTTTARILARALNYETDTTNQPSVTMATLGRHCTEIMESRHPDVIEMDAASNTGVENIREIIESARYKPLTARMKVFIIDEVHMLSKGAFNALLKTLEEPPGHVKFIFATTEVRKVPVTVLSRCQRFDLRRVDVPRLSEHLATITKNEGATANDDALTLIARASEGSVRDGLSILDQAIATSLGSSKDSGHVSSEAVRAMLGLADRNRIFDLMDALFTGQAADALAKLENLIADGADPLQALSDLADAVHVTTRIKAVGLDSAAGAIPAEERRRAEQLGSKLSFALLTRAWQMLLKGIEETGKAPNAVSAAEMVLIRLAYTADLPPPDDIIKALGGTAATQKQKGSSSPKTAATAGATASQATPQTKSERVQTPDTQSETASKPVDAPPFPYEPNDGALDIDEFENEADVSTGYVRPINTFADVVALAGERRDAKLKVSLEEHISLVKFDAGAGSINIHLMPGAAPQIANELREKLNKWTHRQWVIMLSKTPGEPPIGQVRREQEAAEREALMKHPAIASIIDAFPGAEISAVRSITSADDDSDSQAG